MLWPILAALITGVSLLSERWCICAPCSRSNSTRGLCPFNAVNHKGEQLVVDLGYIWACFPRSFCQGELTPFNGDAKWCEPIDIRTIDVHTSKNEYLSYSLMTLES